MTQAAVPAQPITQLTADQFKKSLPEKLRGSITPEIMNTLNGMLADPDMCEAYRDNLLGYTHVMNEGKFKLDGYIHAVKYVSHKLMGCTNIDAFSRTFPDKIQRWTMQNYASKDIASYVSAYNKSKLVNLILEQTLIPTHVLNADIYQKAINVQAKLMMTATSEKVRCEAANSLLTHLKAPEKTKLQIDVSAGTSSLLQDLRANVAALAEMEQRMISSNQITAREAAERKLVFEQAEDAEIIQ
ncbi:hypothetical protein [Pseudomonas phage vB_PaeP_TUMS_P10]|nr:hypothetical protein [Pseudomonas phage vB_PaeS_TUMS_P6]UNI71962.1 hypothetical protein [Pseudomonas phage vB_PaeP_TUMS_P10]